MTMVELITKVEMTAEKHLLQRNKLRDLQKEEYQLTKLKPLLLS